jgi:hypothetical protein
MINAQAQVRSTMIATPTSATTAVKTGYVDTKGYDWATVLINVSAATGGTNAGTTTFSILTGDTNGATYYATVVADKTASVATGNLITYDVDTKTAKRFLKISVTPGVTTYDPQVIDAIAVLTRGGIEPPAATNIAAGETIVA